MPEIYNPDNFKQENLEIPDGEAERLQAKINELLAIQESEIAKFGKKNIKSKQLEMARMELPEAKEIRTLEEVVSDGEGKFHFVWKDDDGYPKNLTCGDIISDMEWGIYYDLNHLNLTGRNLREGYDSFRQRYINHYYQRQIDRFTNMEIAVRFSKSEQNQQIARVYKDIYFKIKNEKEGQEDQAGFMFETMLKCILQKVSEDFGQRQDFGFLVEKGNVEWDMRFKSDIIIKFTRGNRGVNVNEVKGVKGFQVTLISHKDPKYQHKLDQIDAANKLLQKEKSSGNIVPVDEVVEFKVEVNNDDVMTAYKKWLKNGKRSSGPEIYLGTELIMKCLVDIFQQSDLDLNLKENMKNIIREYFEDKR